MGKGWIDGLEVSVRGWGGEGVVAGVFEGHGHEREVQWECVRIVAIYPSFEKMPDLDLTKQYDKCTYYTRVRSVTARVLVS